MDAALFDLRKKQQRGFAFSRLITRYLAREVFPRTLASSKFASACLTKSRITNWTNSEPAVAQSPVGWAKVFDAMVSCDQVKVRATPLVLELSAAPLSPPGKGS